MHDPSQLVGTWRMLTWRREFADTGERIDALGADPVGFVSYGADGRVHAIVVKRDRPTPASLPPSKRLNCSTRCSPTLEPIRCITITSCTMSTPRGIRLLPALT
jgi:Lipocalin-like domain